MFTRSVLLALIAPLAVEFPRFDTQELDPNVGNVCYAVTVADVNSDRRPDVVALTEDAIVWFANPTWEKHVEIKGLTERDNVCIQPQDIDSDGRVDFAVGAAWRPADTQGGGTLQWVRNVADGPWTVHPIASEPTLHRLRWGNVKGDDRPELIVAPLQGRGTKGPAWNEGEGVRVLVFSIPDGPAKDPWPVEVADSSLHTTHNLQPVDWDDDGHDEVILSAWEGVFLLDREGENWKRTKLGGGNQETSPFKGASEVKLGKLRGGGRYIATIEPWHGFQVVVYTPPDRDDAEWVRTVIAEPVSWGHAVWCADLDGDLDQELIIGQRDPNKEGEPRGPGILVFDPVAGSNPIAFERHDLDPGGVAVEDALAADLNADGRPEIIAGGRATHNVRIYWNRPR